MQGRPRRSVLYMPGSNQRALDKGKTVPADALILDLEDAVAPDEKPAADRPSRSRSPLSRRRTAASARSSPSSARCANGSSTTSLIVGAIVRASAQEIAIQRNDPQVGDVVVHFPRAGCLVTRA